MRLAVSATFVAALVTVSGCGDDAASCSVPVDPDFDNGACGSDVQVTGELVDWDTDETFCGINSAQISVGGQMAGTAPNGRFIVCAPDSPDTTLSIMLPAAPSQCTADSSTYTTPTLIYVTQETIKSGATISARSITDTRRSAFFVDVLGQAFEESKAHVLVHVEGNPVAVSLDKAHDPPAAIADTTWALGDTGHEVFFPNVEIGDGRATVSVASGCATPSTVPLMAGTITNVTILTF